MKSSSGKLSNSLKVTQLEGGRNGIPDHSFRLPRVCQNREGSAFEALRNLYHSWEERTSCRLLCPRATGECLPYGTWTAVVVVEEAGWANALSTPGVFNLWLAGRTCPWLAMAVPQHILRWQCHITVSNFGYPWSIPGGWETAKEAGVRLWGKEENGNTCGWWEGPPPNLPHQGKPSWKGDL